MNLLPKSHKDFGEASYWEEFFKKRGQKAFEWYGEYNELCGVLHKYVKLTDDILNIGCGNSTLSADLYDLGHKKITNIDISDVVIRQMISKNAERRPDMQFLKMNMLEMNFSDEAFSVVLDKGTLDAVMTDESEATVNTVNKMFSEISRTLRIGGRYICITLAQDHIIRKVLEHFSNEGWPVRVCRIEDTDEDQEREFHMPVFAFILTKFKKMPEMKPIFEVSYFNEKKERFETKESVLAAVKELQYYGTVRQRLNKGKMLEEQVSLDLFSADKLTPRYTLHVVDSDVKTGNQFAIFIVPDGRETEWMFSSEKGRKGISESAGFQRLVVVTLNRDHTYANLDAIKAELSEKVMELAPPKLGNIQVPFLSIGDDVNQRDIKYKGKSELSGEFVIEDILNDNELHRRLIFLNNRNAVQSAAKLVQKAGKKKKGGKKMQKPKYEIDHNVMCCQYNIIMVAGLALIDDLAKLVEKKLDVVLIGLGGGALATFLYRHFKKMQITAVELDKVMVDLALKWFGFQEAENLKVHIEDGLVYLQDLALKGRRKLHAVLIDVDSKDLTTGISSPHRSFLQKDFIEVLSKVLHPQGVLVMNFVCRDDVLREETLQHLKTHFKTVLSRKLAWEVNEVIYAVPVGHGADLSPANDVDLSETISSNLKLLQRIARLEGAGPDVESLPEKLNELRIL